MGKAGGEGGEGKRGEEGGEGEEAGGSAFCCRATGGMLGAQTRPQVTLRTRAGSEEGRRERGGGGGKVGRPPTRAPLRGPPTRAPQQAQVRGGAALDGCAPGSFVKKEGRGDGSGEEGGHPGDADLQRQECRRRAHGPSRQLKGSALEFAFPSWRDPAAPPRGPALSGGRGAVGDGRGQARRREGEQKADSKAGQIRHTGGEGKEGRGRSGTCCEGRVQHTAWETTEISDTTMTNT